MLRQRDMRAVECRRSAKNPHFPYGTGLPAVEVRVTYESGRHRHVGRQIYPVMRRFPLFIAVCDRNQPT